MIDALSSFAQWLVDLFLWLPREVYSLACDGLATAFEAIPAPDFVAQAQPALNALSGISYFLDLFQLPQGLTILLGAEAIRFLIRRIPVIG